MPSEFIAQNGATIKQTNKIKATGRPAAKKRTHPTKHRRSKKHR
jgi:hypothetical protein